MRTFFGTASFPKIHNYKLVKSPLLKEQTTIMRYTEELLGKKLTLI